MDRADSLSGRIAVVTGASSGLGRATAIALAGRGADVALLARGSADLQHTTGQVTAAGRRASPVVVDLADPDQIRHAVEQVHRELGGIDILVNAAGTDAPAPVEQLDVASWDRVLNVNLRASFLLAQAAFADMRGRGGTIINISSVAGRRGWANAAAYSASKFALTGLTQALAAEGRPHRIRACLLYPGAIDTSWGTWTPDNANPPRDRRLTGPCPQKTSPASSPGSPPPHPTSSSTKPPSPRCWNKAGHSRRWSAADVRVIPASSRTR